MQQNNNNRGQALVLVITILAMLFIIVTAFFVLSQAERNAALRHLDALRAQYIAEAGVAYAQAVLKADRDLNLTDSLEDISFSSFPGSDMDLDSNGANESKAFTILNREGGAFGVFSLKVSDEASRINLNTVSSEVLERLFSSIGVDTSKVNALLSRRPLNAKEEVGSILGQGDFAKAKDFLTVYSRDFEVDLNRNRRVYLNTSQPQLILEKFLAGGIKDPYQKAANLKDAGDLDLAQTLFDKFSQTFLPSGMLASGGWHKEGNYYQADGQDQSPGEFSWTNLALKDGDYFCFLYGTGSADIVSGEPFLYSGEGLAEKVSVEGGNLTLSITPAKDRVSRFSHIELFSLDPDAGLARKVVAGSEALVINELMVKPSMAIPATGPAYLGPTEIKRWTLSDLPTGTYYLMVEAIDKGGLVGDVYIGGEMANDLRDQDYFPGTVNISGTLMIEIHNNSLEQASFKGIKVLHEPDAEFIEILNLSPQSISLEGFSLEVYTPAGELVAGWPARIPEGASIEPYQHLVFAVDSDDASLAPQKLQANAISLQAVYKVSGKGLLFDESSRYIDKESDLLPNSGGRVVLKDNFGERVDGVAYSSSQVKDFTSLERSDPSLNTTDSSGFFNLWYHSTGENLCTPGVVNENPGMYTLNEKTGELTKNNLSQVKVLNRRLSGLSEAGELSSGESWKKFSTQDLSRMSDRFAYEAVTMAMAQKEEPGGSDTQGVWKFSNIAYGNYLLSILTDSRSLEGEEIEVEIRTASGTDFTDLRTLIFNNQVAFYGSVQLPDNAELELRITAQDRNAKALLKEISLEPVFSTPGRINVNTAATQVLNSIFNSGSLVNSIIQARPIGLESELGVGALFGLDPAFVAYNNLLTVKSDVYEILCRGDFKPQGRTLAYQTIRTVLERGD